MSAHSPREQGNTTTFFSIFHLCNRFESDFSYSLSGFHLEYEIQGCGSIMREPSGRFTSPNYPNPYPHDMRCQWAIEVDYGQLIVIEFKDFDFEATTGCDSDGLTVCIHIHWM